MRCVYLLAVLTTLAVGCGSSANTGLSTPGGTSGSSGSGGSSGTSGAGGSAGTPNTGGSSGTGGTGTGGTAGAGGTGAAGGAGATGGAAGAAGAGAVDCSTRPIVFPSFDRGCTNTPSCVAVVHQISCCGTLVVTGINHAERNAFDAAEQTCESQYPQCGCDAQPTKTDTGQTVTDVNQVKVECRNGTCTTYLP